MRAGVPASIALHALLFGASVFAWNLAPPSPPMPPSIPISMVKIGPETNIEAAKALENPDAQEAPTPPQIAEGDPTPGSESGVEESTNLKAPPPKQAVSDMPSDKKPVKADEKQTQAQNSKDKNAPDRQVQKGQEFDFAKMVNKATQKYAASTKNDQPVNAKDDAIGRRAVGKANQMAASAEDALREQLKRCWRAPIDQPNPERLIITLRVFLNRDGTVSRAPTVEKPNPIPAGDRGMVIASENALRAVRTCAPYDLPDESFDIWKEVVLRFDPREMLNQ